MTFKRFRIFLSLFIFLGIPATFFIWDRIENYHLDKVFARLRASGEPITPQELNLNSVPDQQNASLDYLAAGDSINTNSVDWKAYDQVDPPFQYPLTAAELTTVQNILSENTAAISKVISARTKHAGGWNDHFENPTVGDQYNFNSERTLCHLLELAAIQAHQTKNDAFALQYLTDMLTEADASEQRPTIVGHLVAIGETAAASESISQLCVDGSIGADGFSREQVSYLIKQLQNEKPMNDGIKLSWRSDRIEDLIPCCT